MDNAIYIALSRQQTLRRALDVTANNIANADTAGFKVEELLIRTEPRKTAANADVRGPVKFAYDDRIGRDFGQGEIAQTDRPLDVAIEGDGFLTVQTPAGERYTRDGRLTLSPDGLLVNQDGQPILSEGGAEITLDPAAGEVTIGVDGSIEQGGAQVAKLAVVRFDSLSAIEKDGNNFYRNDGATAVAAPDAQVRQGMLEHSNVNSVLQITRLIELSRAYEQTSRLMDMGNDLTRRSVERLGKVS